MSFDIAGLDDFNADELMASLEASTTPMEPSIKLIHPEMANGEDLDASLENLLNKAESPGGPDNNKDSLGPQKKKLERVISRTGRPEEIFHTIKKKNPKGNTSIKVGDYQLGAKLGRGAFGAVYKGLDLKTGQFVALKRIGIDKIDGDSMMKEINFLKKFQHKNIVRYIGLVKTEKHMNLVLEFVDSGSLSQVLAGYGFFPESLAAIYISQVLEGLMYLHSQQIIHRDIKGGNLLITREGSIKLADFGIATVVSQIQRHSLVEGSPYWMAPEVITQSHAPTTSSDIWSIGCTVIELLTGFPPYFDMVAMSAIYKMVNEDCPPLPDDITEKARDFLIQCFIKDPSERPTAADLRKHPWILEHVPDLAPESLPDVDEVRKTVKNFTLTKEAGLQLSRDLRQMLDHEEGSSNKDPEDGYDSLDDDKEDDDKGSFDKKRNSKHKRKKSRGKVEDDELFDMSGMTTEGKKKTKKGKKSTLGKFRSRKVNKDKITRDSDPEMIASSDSSLMVVNIYGVETRRSIFTFTVYKIKVMQDSRVWDIERTWSDFKEMHTRLETEFGPEDLPHFSARKFWGVLDSDFVRKRWQELQHYLLELMKSKEIRDSNAFLSFLTAKS